VRGCSIVRKIKRYLFIVSFCILGIGGTVLFPMEVIKGIFWGNGPLVSDLQGNMYLGFDDHSISKYSLDGKLLLKIGRDGEGPGDIKRICWYAFNKKDNTLYVTEFYNGNRWVSRFSPDGKFIGDWKFEFNWLIYNVVSYIDFDKEGNVFLIAQKQNLRHYKDYIVNNEVYDLLKFSPGGKLLKMIYSFNIDRDAEKPGNFQVTIPFQNRLSWVVCQDKIIVKETSGGFIQVFTSNGELEKKIPFPVKPAKVTEQDLDAWEKRLKSQSFIQGLMAVGKADVNYWRKNLVFPEYKPNSSWRMLTDSKGYLYLSEYDDPYDEKENLSWYKVNCQTGNVDTLKFKPGEELVRVWGEHFFFYKVLEDQGEEIETIIRLNEKELFNR